MRCGAVRCRAVLCCAVLCCATGLAAGELNHRWVAACAHPSLPPSLPSLLCIPSHAFQRLLPAAAPLPAPEYEGRPLRFFSANNTLKTYYGPALVRPLSFLRCQ